MTDLYLNAHSHYMVTGHQGLNCLLHQFLYIFQYITSLGSDLYSLLGKQKALKNTFQATTFKVEENSRSFREKMKFKDFTRSHPKIQGLFKTARTL